MIPMIVRAWGEKYENRFGQAAAEVYEPGAAMHVCQPQISTTNVACPLDYRYSKKNLLDRRVTPSDSTLWCSDR